MLISPEYAALNREMHATKPQYGTSANRWALQVNGLAHHVRAESVLDYGAGKGALKAALGATGYEMREYDPAIEGLDTSPEPADVVVCLDVLEHIEPEYIDNVLDDLKRLARKAVMLVISTVPAQKTLPDGRNPHLIVEPPKWWFPKLLERWELWDYRINDKGFLAVMGAI